MEISPKFAHLPNGIIREIVAYTGATYKKRNGKYMGQIPKNDIRYVLLLTIPNKRIWTNIHPDHSRNLVYFHSKVNLTRSYHYDLERVDLGPIVYMDVHGFTYTNDPCLGNRETIEYKLSIVDWTGKERNYSFEYYKNDEKIDALIAKIIELREEQKQLEKRILILERKHRYLRNVTNMFIATSMFACGVIIQRFY